MTKEGSPWDLLIEGATCEVENAKRDVNAARNVLEESIIGLRGWLRGIKPDPHRLVYLAALLESLEAIEQGADPGAALHLKQGHRRKNPSAPIRDVVAWVKVGEELDRLTVERGHTREDKPIGSAIRTVAKGMRLSTDVVRKAWDKYGAEAGWQGSKADWK